MPRVNAASADEGFWSGSGCSDLILMRGTADIRYGEVCHAGVGCRKSEVRSPKSGGPQSRGGSGASGRLARHSLLLPRCGCCFCHVGPTGLRFRVVATVRNVARRGQMFSSSSAFAPIAIRGSVSRRAGKGLGLGLWPRSGNAARRGGVASRFLTSSTEKASRSHWSPTSSGRPFWGLRLRMIPDASTLGLLTACYVLATPALKASASQMRPCPKGLCWDADSLRHPW